VQPELHTLVAAERLRDDHGVRPEETPEPALRKALRPGDERPTAPRPSRT
jgi:hypothetical protein